SPCLHGKLGAGAEVRYRMALRGGPARGGRKALRANGEGAQAAGLGYAGRNAPISLRVHGSYRLAGFRAGGGAGVGAGGAGGRGDCGRSVFVSAETRLMAGGSWEKGGP